MQPPSPLNLELVESRPEAPGALDVRARRPDAVGELAVGGHDADRARVGVGLDALRDRVVGRVAPRAGAKRVSSGVSPGRRRSRGRPSKKRATGSPASRANASTCAASLAAAAARSRHHPSGRAPMTLLPSTIQRIRRKVGAPLATVRPVRLGSEIACAALLACALVPALASCGGGGGGGSSDDGGAGVRGERQQGAAGLRHPGRRALEGDLLNVVRGPRPQTLRSFRDRGRRVGGDLRAIKPPAKVRGLHDQLIRAVDGYGDDVTTAAEALNSGSPAKLRAAQRELQQATRRSGRRSTRRSTGSTRPSVGERGAGSRSDLGRLAVIEGHGFRMYDVRFVDLGAEAPTAQPAVVSPDTALRPRVGRIDALEPLQQRIDPGNRRRMVRTRRRGAVS